jgi:hypothetical protein
MTTFILWWLISSVIGLGINYFLMKATDDDQD